EVPYPAPVHCRVRVIQDVNRETRFRFPGETFNNAFSFDLHRLRGPSDPCNRIPQQTSQIRMAGLPHGSLNIPRKVNQSALSALPNHDSRFIRMWLSRIREFGRISYKSGHDRQHRPTYRRNRYPVFCAGNPLRIREAIKNGMTPLDPRQIRIAICPHHFARLVDVEDLAQPEIRARPIALRV